MEQLWDKILEEVSKQIPAVYYGSFISPLSLLNYDDQKLVIVAPSKTIKNHVEQKYQHYIEEAIYKIGGSKLKVEINIDSQSSFIGDLVNEKFKDNNLSFNSDYTFDEFAVGESNRLAFSACQEILKRPGEINPLYIHGGVSVGKTHLLQAIGRELQSKFPPNTVKYLPISNFLSEFVFTLQNRQSMEAFRLKYQSYSVLIIDDESITISSEQDIIHKIDRISFPQHCSDNVLNNNEEQIDCGGDCLSCELSCNGCFIKGICVPRTKSIKTHFCSYDGFLPLKKTKAFCTNDEECLSKKCIGYSCE